MPHRSERPRAQSTVLIILSVLAVLLGCSRQTGDEMVYRYLRSVAGKDATDCGHVGLHQRPAAANDCTLAASKAKASFFVRYDVQGIDSELVVGLASRGEGEASSVRYDSLGWSTDGLGEDKVFEDSHRLVTPCPRSVRLFPSSSGYLSCYE